MKRLSRIAATTALALTTTLSALSVSAETLTFVSWQKDDPSFGAWWDEVIAEFEATHEGVDIEMTRVARNEYATSMFTMFAGAAPPDIVHLAAFEYQPFAAEGWLEPLDPYIAESGLDLTGWAGQATCEWDGNTSCLMLLYAGYVMAYNEALLADAGVTTPPTDWESFLAAARAATKDTDGDGVTDKFGVGMPTKGASSVMHGILNFVLGAGGDWTVDGKPTFDSEGTIEGLRRWKQLFDEGLTPRDLGTSDMRQLHIEGHIAMLLDGPWVRGVQKRAAEDMLPNLKLAKTPFSPPVGGTSNVLAIPSDISDERKNLVWDFIQIAASEKYQQRFSAISSSPAPRPGLDYSAEIAAEPYFELIAEQANAAAAAGVDRLPRGLEIEFPEVGKIVLQEVQRMLIEDIDPAVTGKTIQERVLAIKK
ncbi:sugar ABC transporter substrate-binding protein [Cognatishimia sp. WU-CL00825]|uniref:ABC transporter substrate-binding protein n=1 Tax=Cognatishimia sp. WU-CL00825 TaxID=3127658 RepID=UPI003103F2B3